MVCYSKCWASRTCYKQGSAWPGQACGVTQYSWSWLEGHAFSLVLEGLVHERRQVPLAEAREDSLQPQTKNKRNERAISSHTDTTRPQDDGFLMTQAEAAYDDELAPVLGPPGDSDGGDRGRTRRYPDLKVKGKTGVVISSPADAELELEQQGSVRSLARLTSSPSSNAICFAMPAASSLETWKTSSRRLTSSTPGTKPATRS